MAHSRDGPEGVKRTHVQDLIEKDVFRIWKLLTDEKAWVYVSGYIVASCLSSALFVNSLMLDRSSNKMPAGVKAALAKAAEIEGGYSEEDAKKYVVTMVREGRLIEECWS